MECKERIRFAVQKAYFGQVHRITPRAMLEEMRQVGRLAQSSRWGMTQAWTGKMVKRGGDRYEMFREERPGDLVMNYTCGLNKKEECSIMIKCPAWVIMMIITEQNETTKNKQRNTTLCPSPSLLGSPDTHLSSSAGHEVQNVRSDLWLTQIMPGLFPCKWWFGTDPRFKESRFYSLLL